MRKGTNPDYRCEQKRECHIANMDTWNSVFGRRFLNSDEKYITLADDRSFEIETLEKEGFLSAQSNFIGVNDDLNKIHILKKMHPEVKFITHKWDSLILGKINCRSGFIYLDGTNVLDTIMCKTASDMTITGMRLFKGEGMIAANFCQFNPRNPDIKGSIDLYLYNISLSPASDGWSLYENMYFPKLTSKTPMVTTFFVRKST